MEFEKQSDNQLPNTEQQNENEENKFLPPLQQISEARSNEEATPALIFNKYKQAKFQTR